MRESGRGRKKGRGVCVFFVSCSDARLCVRTSCKLSKTINIPSMDAQFKSLSRVRACLSSRPQPHLYLSISLPPPLSLSLSFSLSLSLSIYLSLHECVLACLTSLPRRLGSGLPTVSALLWRMSSLSGRALAYLSQSPCRERERERESE